MTSQRPFDVCYRLYLKQCVALYPKVLFAFHGDAYGEHVKGPEDVDRCLKTLENEFQRKDDWFTFTGDHLNLLVQLWPFNKFWPIDLIGLNLPISVHVNRADPLATVQELYKKVLHIEVVSIILRFADPSSYAVMSPVTERFLLVQPETSHPRRYVKYLKLLRDIKEKYDLNSVAEVDMAIWTLAHFVNERIRKRTLAKMPSEEDRELIHEIVKYYAADLNIRKIGLKPVLDDVYDLLNDENLEPNRLLLAKCLNGEKDEDGRDPHLAMVTTGHAFEWLVWNLIKGCKEEAAVRRKWGDDISLYWFTVNWTRGVVWLWGTIAVCFSVVELVWPRRVCGLVPRGFAPRGLPASLRA